jgi:cell wall-associated NlpC family hydrolase
VGDRYSFASIGPDQFDCSGLVWFTFKEAGLRDRIGDKRRTAAGYYRYFNNLGKADKLNPQPGDLVVWGNNQHIGVYVGDGMAVSALNERLGVKLHKVSWLSMRLKAYLHVGLER